MGALWGISVIEHYKRPITGFGLLVGGFGEGSKRRGFALDWIVPERGNCMVGYL